MSRVAWFDCAAGASGDMILGALLDLGLPLDALRAELGKVALSGYELEVSEVQRCGMRARKFDVIVGGKRVGPAEEQPRAHDPGHAHDHDHGHAHDHEPVRPHAHGRRAAEILALLESSRLAAEVKERSIALFRRLAEAEAAVHGTTPEEVHFHEVGTVDSIVDIVGSVFALRWLGVDRFVSSSLNVGGGTVEMSHGTYPVPPPATARLVAGALVHGAGTVERLTPTGALLVTGHATEYGPLPPMRLARVGHGAGLRDTPDRPNVLRILVGEEVPTAGERALVIEAEIDDAPPQILGGLIEQLLALGVKDAYFTPVQMKKSRPGVLVTVLAAPGQREAVEELLFRETTTLGVRAHECERTTLEREIVTVATPYGDVGVKVGRRGTRVYNAQPEFEDCRRAAQAAGVPVKEVLAAAVAAYRGRE
jgi:uncharacterized protein (TIGR00299 family) protein